MTPYLSHPLIIISYLVLLLLHTALASRHYTSAVPGTSHHTCNENQINTATAAYQHHQCCRYRGGPMFINVHLASSFKVLLRVATSATFICGNSYNMITAFLGSKWTVSSVSCFLVLVRSICIARTTSHVDIVHRSPATDEFYCLNIPINNVRRTFYVGTAVATTCCIHHDELRRKRKQRWRNQTQLKIKNQASHLPGIHYVYQI